MRRILVVEDDQAMSQHIGDILTRAGFKVSAAFDGVAGLEAIRSCPPDLVVLDIFMPEKDGLEMLVELRRLEIMTPVLIISGKQHLLSGASMALAEQLGASGALAKPFTPKELLNQVTRIAGMLETSEPAR
jgi:DNA-binding response OmpR family regulator